MTSDRWTLAFDVTPIVGNALVGPASHVLIRVKVRHLASMVGLKGSQVCWPRFVNLYNRWLSSHHHTWSIIWMTGFKTLIIRSCSWDTPTDRSPRVTNLVSELASRCCRWVACWSPLIACPGCDRWHGQLHHLAANKVFPGCHHSSDESKASHDIEGGCDNQVHSEFHLWRQNTVYCIQYTVYCILQTILFKILE